MADLYPRAAILARIATALRDEPARALPEPQPIFGAEPAADRATLAARFRDELKALSGEARFVATAQELPGALAQFLKDREIASAACQNSIAVRWALTRLPEGAAFSAADADKLRVAGARCAVIAAEALLADTGSVVAAFSTSGERLLPYLPRTCIVIADESRLHSHMTLEALAPLYARARAGERGEFVIITGPSRSADIEKTLVLGAHGPQFLVVFIVGVTP
ncbi:MAG TPA: LUD domain-containing protein [Candidatus Tumulicola sp.]|nr:LUD domain-containing protein [Candidatus Tumulicola sp.]